MSVYSLTLAVPASVTTGAALDVSYYNNVIVEISGTFVATVQIEASIDGTNFAPFGSAFTAPGFLALPDPIKSLRAKTTAYTSGTPVGLVGGSAA